MKFPLLNQLMHNKFSYRISKFILIQKEKNENLFCGFFLTHNKEYQIAINLQENRLITAYTDDIFIVLPNRETRLLAL